MHVHRVCDLHTLIREVYLPEICALASIIHRKTSRIRELFNTGCFSFLPNCRQAPQPFK